jgi:hypothetical protein
MMLLSPCRLLGAMLCVSALAAGCGGDDEAVGGSGSEADVNRPPRNDAGVGSTDADSPDAGDPSDGTGADFDGADGADPLPNDGGTEGSTDADSGLDAGPSDTGPADSGPTPDYDPACDLDLDGVMAIGCTVGATVGTDCNDRDPAVKPGQAERCDAVDNNCNGSVNEGLDCGIYAHTSNAVFTVDVFNPSAAPTPLPGSPPGTILDFDTSPDGLLYGVTSNGLVRYDPATSAWSSVGSFFISGANGFAILSPLEGYITAGEAVYRVDLTTGDTTEIGAFGGDFSSSGDCVINKDGTLFMSSRAASGRSSDRLVIIDLAGVNPGRATLVGEMTALEGGRTVNVSGVYGLTFAYGELYAFTSNGKVYRIDSLTGTGEFVATFSGRSWYGAASSPGR